MAQLQQDRYFLFDVDTSEKFQNYDDYDNGDADYNDDDRNNDFFSTKLYFTSYTSFDTAF